MDGPAFAGRTFAACGDGIKAEARIAGPLEAGIEIWLP